MFFIIIISITLIISSVKIIQATAVSDESQIKSIQNCEKGEYHHDFNLGGFVINVEKNQTGKCIMTMNIVVEKVETKYHCVFLLNDLAKIAKWYENPNLPSFEGLAENCDLLPKNLTILGLDYSIIIGIVVIAITGVTIIIITKRRKQK